MKRRTRRPTQGSVAAEHANAFDHATKVFEKMIEKRKLGEKQNHVRGRRIRFKVKLEIEAPGEAPVAFSFSNTRGFRLEWIGGSRAWNITDPVNPEQIRDLTGRLRAYREKLINFQNLHEGGFFTFRSFNLLLAALSYDVAANP